MQATHTTELHFDLFKGRYNKVGSACSVFPLELGVTPNPDLHGLINWISIDNFLLSAHSTT